MVLAAPPIAGAIDHACLASATPRLLLTSPQGRRLEQSWVQELSQEQHLVVICGHYEGIDARIAELVDEEVSLGDFVLTGGEIAACAVVDAVARLLPGVLGNADSAVDESFSHGLLEYPQYTRPRTWRGHEVPEILLSGHHGRIDAWRQAQSEAITKARRPDLWVAWARAKGIDPEGLAPDDGPA